MGNGVWTGIEMRRVYVAGLISRNTAGTKADVLEFLDNVRAGATACIEVIHNGMAAFCPFFDYQYNLMDNAPLTREMFYKNSVAWLEVSDAVLVISGEGIGSGVDREIKRAKELNIPIFRSFEELMNWKNGTK